MNNPNEAVLGKVIDDFLVLGIERDGSERWVGADIEINVHELGHFFLRVVTKDQFISEKLQGALDDIKTINPAWFEEQQVDERPPYVLNDEELNENILKNKLLHRVVREDLAATLWPTDDDN